MKMDKHQMEEDNAVILWAAAARGAKMLDEEIPDWPTRIDVGDLRMENGQACILGQLFMGRLDKRLLTGYAVGINQLNLSPRSVERYGFVLPITLHCACDYGLPCEGQGPREWSMLAEAWVDEIKCRLDKGVQV